MVFGFPVAAEILVFAALLAVVSKVLQFVVMDRKKFLASQKRMKEHQKRMNELSKKEDEASKKELEKTQKEMLEDLNASMQNMMKMMVVSLIVFGPALFLLKEAYAHELVGLPFALPILHSTWAFEITNHVSWFWAYIYSSIASSLVLSLILKALKIEQ
ncbi:MAG: EMC3/TMCO1 family protein [Candidatus Diapherotrites archaeon]|nr:EMC3/TMCO1 family protein [Candidatus Diapherotrites archaeon]